MSLGRGRVSRSSWAGVVSSSSMISLQRSMHSSQMYTPGPAISFFTCRWLLPQKLHSSCSFVSVGRATANLVLRDHAVDDSVLLRLLGAHEVVALGVARDLLHRLPGVVGDDLVEPLANVEDLACVALDVGRLTLE